jgi:hypothetical protein
VAFRHVYLRVPQSVHPAGWVGVRYVLCVLNRESEDLWGTTWTPAEVNASDFGVVIRVELRGGTEAKATPSGKGGETRYIARPLALFAPSTRREGKVEVPYPFGCIKGPPRARDLPRWYKEAGLWLITHPGAWAKAVVGDIEAYLDGLPRARELV